MGVPQATLSQPVILRLPQLIQQIQLGYIRIPRFQRPFVWSDSQRRELLDSVLNGLPIGSLMLWRTKVEIASNDSLGVHSLNVLDLSTKEYLLDGHQRVTTLYNALVPYDGLVVEGAPYPFYYDLKEEIFVLNKKPKGQVPPMWLPLDVVLETRSLLSYIRRLFERCSGEENVELWAERAEVFQNSFKDYHIPCIPLLTDDLSIVTDSFKRLNSGGTPMSETHMLNALTFTKDNVFELSREFERVLQELVPLGWGELDEKVLLNILKGIHGLNLAKSNPILITKKLKDLPFEQMDAVCKSASNAADWLRRCVNVCGPSSLPYINQFVLLADAFNHAGYDGSLDSASLVKWFWITSYTEYFGGMNSTQITRAQDHLRRLVANAVDPEPPDCSMSVRALVDISSDGMVSYIRYDYRSARIRCFNLFLASLAVGSDEPLMPFCMLANYGNLAVTVGFSSQSMTNPANRFIVDPEQSGSFKKLLRSPEQLGRMDDVWFEMHAIDSVSREALLAQDIDGFLKFRLENLNRIESGFIKGFGLQVEPHYSNDVGADVDD